MAILGDATMCPDIPMDISKSWRLRKAQYGDGYQQRVLDGINAQDLTFNVTWTNRKQATISAIDAVLLAANGDAFQFQHPISGSIFRVVCDEWTVTWESKIYATGAIYGSIRAALTRFNGVGV